MSDKIERYSDFAALKEALKGVKPIAQERADIERPSSKVDSRSIDYRRQAAMEQDELVVDGLSSTQNELLSAEESVLFAMPGVQERLLKRMQAGHLPWEAGLDLHGFTIDMAREELHLFIKECRRKGDRTLLIVHGKAYTDPGKPALMKTYVTGWLQQTDGVIAFCSAQPQDGGTGALYVLLKRDQDYTQRD